MRVKSRRRLTVGITVFLTVAAFMACDPNNGRGNRKDRAIGAYVAAAEAYAQEHYAEALEYTQESLRLDAQFYQAEFLMGKILFFQDKREEAGQVFAALIAKYPEYTEARIWNLRCRVLSVPSSPRENSRPSQNLKDIRAALDREISFNSTDWRVLYLYALLAGNTGDWEKHLSMGRQAEAALSDSSKLYLDMALTWHSLGLEDRAELSLEKARIVSGGNISIARLEEATAEFLRDPPVLSDPKGE